MDDNVKYAIIGGSTKCGTTSVFKYFEFHPGICPCIMKESRYFLEDNYHLIATKRKSGSYQSFDSLFTNCNTSQIKFEATPDYLYSTNAPEKIKGELGRVKIIFILRDPVDRLKSWYKFAKLNGLISEGTTFSNYIQIQNSSDENKPQHLRSLEQGRYSEFLKYYFKIFDRKDIVICFYEQLVENPESFCKSLSKSLDIDPDYFNNYDFKIHNKSVAVKSVEAHKLFRKFKRTVRPATRLLHNSFRKKLKLAGYKIEQAYSNANKATTDIEMSADNETMHFLNEYYGNEKNALTNLTGIIPPWQTTSQQENK